MIDQAYVEPPTAPDHDAQPARRERMAA